MEQRKISIVQLVILLFLCRSFNQLSADILNVTGHYGMEHLLAIPLALAIQAALAVPAFLLIRKSGRGLTGAAFLTLGKGGIVFALFSCTYLLLAAGITVYNLAAFLANAIYPRSSAVFFIITLVVAGMYAAHLGLEGISRSSVILFGLFLLSLTLTFLGVADRVNMLNLRPLMEGSGSTILEGAWRICARSSTVYLFVLLSARASGKKAKGFGWYLAAVGLMMELVGFFVSTVLGELAVSEAYPFFMLTTVAQISIFQRMDALHVAIWVMVSFLRVAVFLWIMREQFVACLPLNVRENGRVRWVLPFFAGLVAGIAAWMVQSREAAVWFLDFLSSGFMIAALLAGIPLVCLVIGGVRGKFRKTAGTGGES